MADSPDLEQQVYDAIDDAVSPDVIAWEPQAVSPIGNATEAVMRVIREHFQVK